jgi:tRNA(Ile)-lysidine synthase
MAREDTDLLDALAESWQSEHDLALEELAALPDAVRRRVLHRAILAAGAPSAEVTRDHVLAVDGLVTAWRGQKWIDLPGHLRAIREPEGDRARVVFRPIS